MKINPTHPSRRGFTLVELLVVIGIIAVLIAILLPALQAARRQANSVKCLSNLRQLGLALQLYEGEYKGYWPVAMHENGPPPLLPDQRRWPDFLAKFIASNKDVKFDAVDQFRERSVLWGCPEWSKSSETAGTGDAFADKVRVGYGMQYYPFAPQRSDTSKWAIFTVAVKGQYVKAAKWRVRGANRPVIVDAITHIVGLPNTFSISSTKWSPNDPLAGFDPDFFQVDALRHARKGLSKQQTANTKGMNALYADGHADSASVVQIYFGMRDPNVTPGSPPVYPIP